MTEVAGRRPPSRIEAEHRVIPERAIRSGRDIFVERAARWRAVMAGRVAADSADLIQGERDRDR
jgi:hypothetical protein